jgi:two-component system, NtrC family, sensor kinase
VRSAGSFGLARSVRGLKVAQPERLASNVIHSFNALVTVVVMDLLHWGPVCAAYLVFEVALSDALAPAGPQAPPSQRTYLTVLGYAVVGLWRGAEPLTVAAWSLCGVLSHVLMMARARLLARSITAERDALDRVAAVQRAMLGQEKIMSLGLLSAGVAHEINNPLSYVKWNLAMMAEDMKVHREQLPAQVAGHLDEGVPAMLEGIERIASIVADLGRFARGGEDQAALFDLTKEAQLAARLASGVLNTCKLEMALEPVPPLWGRGRLVAQLLVNLLSNAADAVAGKGSVKLATRVDGAEVVIEVTDDGPGIPLEIRSRIFEPFFTTKPVGKGTGLGLAVVDGVARSHGGSVSVESAPQGGTRFVVRLPLRTGPADGGVAVQGPAQP